MKNKVIVTGREIQKCFNFFPLLRLAIAVTSGCNLKCIHCSLNAGTCAPNELTKDEIIKLINDARELGLVTLPITGGEPTIRKDLLEILKYANKKGLGIILNTNGLCVNKNYASELGKLENLRLVAVSLDGATASTHEVIRNVKGCYEKTVRAIKYLVDAGVNTTMAFTIMRQNSNEISKIVELALELRVPMLRFLFMEEFGRAKKNKRFIIDYLDRKPIIDKISKIARKVKNELNIWVYAPPALVPDDIRKMMPYTAGCLPGVTICDMTSNGDVFPCLGMIDFPELKIGNIRETSMKNLWENTPILKQLRDLAPEDLQGVCGKCYFNKSCMGHCRAASYSLMGRNLKAPNPWCQEYYDHKIFPKKYLRLKQ
jgi:radical SAM protein with 4Fe4S-binding SPASM domain